MTKREADLVERLIDLKLRLLRCGPAQVDAIEQEIVLTKRSLRNVS